MNSELFIENNRVDINAALSSLLTFAIDDVKDFGSRQTTFSKTITLPGTDNNNRIFGHIFETGISNDYNGALDNIGYNFNASKSARCLLFQDNLQSFKGTVRLLQINKDRGNFEYEVALNGDLTTLNVALSSAYIDELDFNYAPDWNETNIIASWDNPGGSGVYFPLIDYGTYSTLKHDWDFRTFRPALYVKEYIDLMFAAAGFRYSSALFETDRFKHLIVPFNRKAVTVTASMNDFLVVSGFQQTDDIFPQIHFTILDTILTPSLSNSRFTNDTGAAITMTATYQLIGTLPSGTGKFEVNNNGTIIFVSNLSPSFNVSGSVSFTLPSLGILEFWLKPLTGPTVDLTVAHIDLTTTTPVTSAATYNSILVINDLLPKNIKQIDFLTSIVKLFNLYVYEDRFDDRLINIAPFVDFYSTDSGNAVDWTYKLNRDQVVKIKPMSELNSKTYNFLYKEDSDYFNELYKKRYNQGYGSYIFDSEFEFASQSSTLELIFASTPLVGYVGEDKVYPTIFKRTGTDASPVEENIDSVIRIMQSKKVTGVTDWDILSAVGSSLATIDEYGYAGHFDDPDNPGNDLNFGVLRELFFTLITGDLTVTQFNIYWSSYMAEICDKDSKMLICKCYLSPRDIFDLDFSKYVVVDAVLWRLNKITDYNTTIPNDCEVQLLNVINTIY